MASFGTQEFNVNIGSDINTEKQAAAIEKFNVGLQALFVELNEGLKGSIKVNITHVKEPNE